MKKIVKLTAIIVLIGLLNVSCESEARQRELNGGYTNAELKALGYTKEQIAQGRKKLAKEQEEEEAAEKAKKADEKAVKKIFDNLSKDLSKLFVKHKILFPNVTLRQIEYILCNVSKDEAQKCAKTFNLLYYTPASVSDTYANGKDNEGYYTYETLEDFVKDIHTYQVACNLHTLLNDSDYIDWINQTSTYRNKKEYIAFLRTTDPDRKEIASPTIPAKRLNGQLMKTINLPNDYPEELDKKIRKYLTDEKNGIRFPEVVYFQILAYTNGYRTIEDNNLIGFFADLFSSKIATGVSSADYEYYMYKSVDDCLKDITYFCTNQVPDFEIDDDYIDYLSEIMNPEYAQRIYKEFKGN
jgi:hypothetical protein